MLNCGACAKLTGEFPSVACMDVLIAPCPRGFALNTAEANIVPFPIVIDPCNNEVFVIVITLTRK